MDEPQGASEGEGPYLRPVKRILLEFTDGDVSEFAGVGARSGGGVECDGVIGEEVRE